MCSATKWAIRCSSLLLALSWLGVAAAAYPGFGQNVTGGDGQQIVTVTTCADNSSSPPAGSLRAAVGGTEDDNRYVVFSVDCTTAGAGPIGFSGAKLDVLGDNVTIDGCSSPRGYIEVQNQSINRRRSNQIIKCIRHLSAVDQGIDAFQRGDALAVGTVLWRVSARNQTDETVSISGSGHADATVAYSIMHDPAFPTHDTNFLIGTGDGCVDNITAYRNLMSSSDRRNPLVTCKQQTPGATTTFPQVDFRNNLLWDVTGDSTSDFASAFDEGATGNVVGNYYKAASYSSSDNQKRAIVVCHAEVTGTHNGSTSTTVLTDTTKNFTALGVQVGWYIGNRTQGSNSTCQITSVGTTTVTCDGLTGGADFSSGDVYDIIRWRENHGYCRTHEDGGEVYVANNQYHGDTVLTGYLNGKGTRSTPWSVPTPQTLDACTSAWIVVRDAGVKPRDSVEQAYINSIRSELINARCFPKRRYGGF